MANHVNTSTATFIIATVIGVVATVLLGAAVLDEFRKHRFETEGTLVSAIVTDKHRQVFESNDNRSTADFFVVYKPESDANGSEIEEWVTPEQYRRITVGQSIEVRRLEGKYRWLGNDTMNLFPVVAGAYVVAVLLIVYARRARRREVRQHE